MNRRSFLKAISAAVICAPVAAVDAMNKRPEPTVPAGAILALQEASERYRGEGDIEFAPLPEKDVDLIKSLVAEAPHWWKSNLLIGDSSIMK